MLGKLLIVEDEPIVAVDLQQEALGLGCKVTGLAESADAALMSVEESRPDLVLMDVRIDGSMDGIQTARLLRQAYQVPVVFLTAHSDNLTLSRASLELPYGYLTKPFRTEELHATLNVAFHKAAIEAEERRANQFLSMTVDGMHEAILLASADCLVQYMNAAAQEMTALPLSQARGKHLSEVFPLTDIYRRSIPLPVKRGEVKAIEEFGWFLFVPGKDRMIVDFTVRSVIAEDGSHGGHVITVRNALERMRQRLIEASIGEDKAFDNSPLAMLQLDNDGRVMRINRKLLNQTDLPMERLVGRRLTDLIDDPDPRITQRFISQLLRPRRPLQHLLARERCLEEK
jgi:CheY-like chemotaxis protein